MPEKQLNLYKTERPETHEKALQALAAAQEEIAELQDSQREERIGWIVATVILFDCLFLLRSENWSGPLIIGILEFAVLAVAAKRLGVQEFAALFGAVIDRFTNMAFGKGD